MELLRFAVVWAVAVVSAFYLLNPTGGRQDLLPDRLAIWGRLDEFVASILLLSALRYFGIDLCRFFVVDRDARERR